MNALTKVKSFFGIGAEGSYRGAAIGIGENCGIFEEPVAYGFQRNLNMETRNHRNVPAVHACVMVTANAISQCNPKHIKENDDGTVEVLKNSNVARVLRRPNEYETWSQFISNIVISMKYTGNAYAIAKRNKRNEIVEFHILSPESISPYYDKDTYSLYYSIGEKPELYEEIDYLVPNRDILHLRQHATRHPLIGESDIAAAAMAVGINVELTNSQLAFFSNMNRPSGILSTDMSLNKDQIMQLREAFDEQSKRWQSGGMPILSSGLKFQQLSVNSVDAQLIEAQKMSVEQIAMAFQVPLPIIGDLSHATYNNTEALMSTWLSISLGALIQNLEQSLTSMFELPYNQMVDLDVRQLLRTNFEGRIAGLTKGVQGGLYTPNEARAVEGLGMIEGGDNAFIQKQNVPISKISELMQQEIDNNNKPEPVIEQPVVDIEEPVDKEFIKFRIKKAMK